METGDKISVDFAQDYHTMRVMVNDEHLPMIKSIQIVSDGAKSSYLSRIIIEILVPPSGTFVQEGYFVDTPHMAAFLEWQRKQVNK